MYEYEQVRVRYLLSSPTYYKVQFFRVSYNEILLIILGAYNIEVRSYFIFQLPIERNIPILCLDTYFFIGIGQFPEAVEHQLKANVVGQRSYMLI